MLTEDTLVIVDAADRELRQRAEAYGALCADPRTVRPLPPPSQG